MSTGAGGSAAREARAAADRVRSLEAELRRETRRCSGFAVAAMSEPRTAAALEPLESRGWRVLHDRRWPGSTRANVDHVAVGPGGVAVIDSKHWSGPISVIAGRLRCDEEDRQEAVENLLALSTVVEELLAEVGGSPPVESPTSVLPLVGMSPLHVLPVLAFTEHDRADVSSARIGRVQLTAVRQLPALLAAQPRVLAAKQVAMVASHLERLMPPAITEQTLDYGGSPRRIGVPLRPAPAEQSGDEGSEAEADALFDVPDLAQQLADAATAPLVEWMGFLHPAQARLVRRRFSGPARVRGAAGTGKSVVMLHRAAWLTTTRPGRVLVTSYVRTLPHHQRAVYERLSPHTVDRVDFLGVHELAERLLADAGITMNRHKGRIDAAFDAAWEHVGRCSGLTELASKQYWHDEIDSVVKGRGLAHVGDYEALTRLGRAVRLGGRERHAVWRLLEAYTSELERRGTHDHNDLLTAAVDLIQHHPPQPGWAAVLVDEVQDLPLAAMRLCALLAGDRPDALFLVGDGQQAIYPGGFTLAEAGISVTGRAVVLRVNYRNTRQILDTARALVEDSDFSDLEADAERGQRDVDVLRDGPLPRTQSAPDRDRLAMLLVQVLRRDAQDGVHWGEMAVLALTHRDADFLREQLRRRDIPLCDLRTWDGQPNDAVKLDTVHRAKGLDFAAVYLPKLRPPPTPVLDEPDAGERQLLRLRQEFVAHTRARDRLWIGTVRPRVLPLPASRGRLGTADPDHHAPVAPRSVPIRPGIAIDGRDLV
ncbi:MAG: AAA family ATPase [Actinomycetota bacterium]|nr:AAA family ATPase [Actinomycetota bacterium]